MKRHMPFIFIAILFFIAAIIMVIISNFGKYEEITDFSYKNVWNEETHYVGLGIVFEEPVMCEKITLFFEEPLIAQMPLHVYYSDGNGLSEINSVWASLRQGKRTESVDIPIGSYVELRLDIEGEFALNRVIIERYSKYGSIYFVLSFVFFVIGLAFCIKVLLSYNSVRQWFCDNFKAVAVFAVIEIIVISYSGNVWMEIEDKTITSYCLDTDYHTEVLMEGQQKFYNIDTHDSFLMYLEFYADILEGNGETEWSLYQKEDCVASGRLYVDDYSKEKYKVQINTNAIQKGQAYQLAIMPVNGTSLQVYVDDNNHLRTIYFYLFQYNSTLYKLLIFFNVAFAIIMLLLLSRLSVYVKYWIIAISMGLLSIALVIPCSTADEFRHFARAYSIANGEFACRKSSYVEIPANLYNIRYIATENSIDVAAETNEEINISKWLCYLKCNDVDETVTTWVGGTSNKGILEYWPQVVAMWIGMAFNIKVTWLFYLARIGNWFVIALIWFVIIRLVPQHKLLFIVLYCMPTNIVYSCTSSTDGLLNALIMLIMAIFIKCYRDGVGLTNRKVVIGVFLITAYIAILKLPYMLTVYSLIALNMHEEDIKLNWKKVIKNIVIITGMCIIAYFLANFFKSLYQSGAGVSIDVGGSGSIKKYNTISWNYVLKVGCDFIQGFIGIMDPYYKEAIYINMFGISILVFPYSVLLVYAGTIEKNEKIINTWQTMLLSIVCVAIWGGVIVAMYFFSGMGTRQLSAIQGRYLSPVIMIGAVILALKRHNQNRANARRYIAAFPVTIMIIGFLEIVRMQWL